MYVDEFGPLLRDWLQLRLGTRAEFWASEPWEVAAGLGIGPYARPKPPDTDDEGGSTRRRGRGRRVRSRAKAAHARPQRELLQARVAHAKDPDNHPAPQPVVGADTAQGVLGGL